MDYMAAKMDDRITGALSENEQLLEEIERLRTALKSIKARVCGEAMPNWENTPRTGGSRDVIADVCDAALGQGSNSQRSDNYTIITIG